MKIIEPSSNAVKKDGFQKLLDRAKGMLSLGDSGNQAEDVVLGRFARGLDNRYVLLHRLQLEGTGGPFPPILIGPTGMAVLNLSRETGFFKAREDTWWRMDKTSRQFSPARPNLIRQSQEYAKKLAEILDVRGKSHPEITPILILVSAGAHIETTNPAIRIVLMDGVDSLIAGIHNSQETLQPMEINLLADSLEVMANPEKAIPMGEGEDFFGRDLLLPEKKAPPKLPNISLPTEVPLPPVEEKLQFSKKQWSILIVLLVLTILVLLGAIVFALGLF